MNSLERIGLWDKIFPKAFPALLAVFVTIYLSPMTNYSISIDDEHSAWRTESSIWITQGRWGSYLVERYLFPHPVVPFLPQFLFGVSVTIGFLILSKIFKEPWASAKSALLFAVFVSMPIWSFILEFYGNAIAAGMGFALVSVAASQTDQLAREGDFRSLILKSFLGITSLAFAISVYQSYILLFVGVAAGIILNEVLFSEVSVEIIFKKLFAFSFICIISVAFYYLIWKIFLHFAQVQPAYIESFFTPQVLLDNPWAVFQTTLKEAFKVYIGAESVFAHNAWSYAILTLCGFAAILFALLRRGIGYFLFGLVVFIGMILAPFALNLFSGGYVPYRSLVGVPFAIWLLAACLLRICSTATSKNTVLALLCVVLIQNWYSLEIFDANTRLVETHDELLAEQVYLRISQVRKPLPVGTQQPVEFFGAKSFVSPYPKVASSTAGYSFFEWDGGNPYRILSFLRLMGHADLTAIDVDTRIRLLPEFETMPVWPQEGSVKLSGGVVLVKMGDEAGSVHKAAHL